jgi:hypothetical protein
MKALSLALFAIALGTLPAGTGVAATDRAPPQLAYDGYPSYRCVEQRPTGRRLCYKVPRLNRPTVTL